MDEVADSSPSLWGMLVYKEETSSVTRIELSSSGPSFWSWRRKWVVSLMKDGSF